MLEPNSHISCPCLAPTLVIEENMTTPTKSGPTRKKRHSGAIPYLIPAALFYGAFLLYPMIDTVRLSFHSWSGFRTDPQKFVGISNYVKTFTSDPVFWTATLNTIIWVVLSIVVLIALPLLLAIVVNQKLFGSNTFRSIFYIPYVLASITVAAVWRWIYSPTIGALNQFLEAIGLESWVHEWLGDPKTALYSIFIASVWHGVGFNMVLFLAGLQQVPEELIDSSKVDGANIWQRFINVVLPSLRPTFVVVMIMTIINSLKVFELIIGMTGGGPAQATQVLALWSYVQSFSNHDFGQGAAIATILLAISLCLVIPYLRWSLKDDEK